MYTHTHTHIHTHTHTHTYIYIYIYIYIIRVLVVTKSLCGYVSNQVQYFVVFSIFNSFHLLNCLMNVVLQKTSWNLRLQNIFHRLNIYIYIYHHHHYYYFLYIYIYIYIYICVCVCVCVVRDRQTHKDREGQRETERERLNQWNGSETQYTKRRFNPRYITVIYLPLFQSSLIPWLLCFHFVVLFCFFNVEIRTGVSFDIPWY